MENTQETLKSYLSSWSWRATYPLRKISYWLGGSHPNVDLVDGRASHQLASLQKSVSWNVTAPIRHIDSILHFSLSRNLSKYETKIFRVFDVFRKKRARRENLANHFMSGGENYILPLLDLAMGARISENKHVAGAKELLHESVAAYSYTLREGEHAPVASIIVPAYEKFSLTCICLASIFKSAPTTPFEVIIADDGSPSNNYSQLFPYSPLIKVVKTNGSAGFLKNCNNAAECAAGQNLVFLNNDTVVFPGWLDGLIRRSILEGGKAITGSKLLNPDGTLQEAGAIIWNDGTGCNYGRNDNPFRPIYNKVRKVDYCSGASLCVPRSIWQELRGFDEHFSPAYCEEVDFSFRARDLGYETIYEPESVLIHLEGASYGTDTSVGVKSHQTRNQQKLRERHATSLAKIHCAPGCNFEVARHRPLSGRLLVVDHMLPEYDRDAGSRSMWHIFKTLARNGHVIYVYPSDGRVSRTAEDIMHANGFEVLGGKNFRHGAFGSWLKANIHHFDGFLLSRPMDAIGYIDLIANQTSAPLMFYGHDIHHIRWRRTAVHQSTHDAALSLAKASHLEAIEKYIWERARTNYYPSSDETSIVNAYLTGRGFPATAHTIPLNAFEKVVELGYIDLHYRNTLIFVGGFRHPPNEDAVLWFVRNVWPIVTQALPQLRLAIVGSHPTEEIRSINSRHTTLQSNISDEALSEIYRRSLVAIAPLRSGGGLKGKITEAMAHGVPVVTTPVGAEGFQDAEKYLHVTADPLEMASMIMNLAKDQLLWVETSQNATGYLREHFSYEAMWRALSKGLKPLPREQTSSRRL